MNEYDPALLDNPAWASLTGTHRSFALGGPLARRYRPDINVFAATHDDSTAALSALAELVQAHGECCVLRARPVIIPAGVHAVHQAPVVQLVAAPETKFTPARRLATAAVTSLAQDDADAMLALARLTEPGPFAAQTWRMGAFVGIRDDGQLIAMAGERFHCGAFTEVSGVCVHPEFRHRGYGRYLSTVVAARIQARGERPFLHSWADHEGALHLYAALGFRVRCSMNFARISTQDGG